MYKYLDKLLEIEKKKVRTSFNRLSVMGFDELNVVNTKRTTQAIYDRFLADNEAMYLKAAKDAYRKALTAAEREGLSGESDEIDSDWLVGVLAGVNFVSGYLYSK